LGAIAFKQMCHNEQSIVGILPIAAVRPQRGHQLEVGVLELKVEARLQLHLLDGRRWREAAQTHAARIVRHVLHFVGGVLFLVGVGDAGGEATARFGLFLIDGRAPLIQVLVGHFESDV